MLFCLTQTTLQTGVVRRPRAEDLDTTNYSLNVLLTWPQTSLCLPG